MARKNVRRVGERPLIAWTIEAARSSRLIDRLILSSEDAEIIRVATEWGCEAPFVRPDSLAQDDTPGVAPVLDAIRRVPGYDYVVLLQPTSPLRTAEDIDGCLEACLAAEAPACVSVTREEHSPYWLYSLDSRRALRPWIASQERPTRRQDAAELYRLNGAVYVARTDWLQATEAFLTDETLAYPMPPSRSLDIDTEWDMQVFEALVQAAKT